MSEDTLLQKLASRAREQQSDDWVDDALWERYAAGDLSDDELNELLARTPSKDADRLRSAYAPLDESFTDDVVAAVTGQIEADSSQAALDDASRADTVVTLESRRRNVFVPLAMAATLILAIGTWHLGQSIPGASPLPAYEIAVLGGSEFRSSDSAPVLPEFVTGDRIEIRLTPATAIDDAVVGQAFVQTTQGLMPLDSMTVEVAPTGAARITGRAGDALPLSSGINTLVILVGQSARVPDATVLYRRFSVGGDDRLEVQGNGWQAWRVRLMFETT